MIVLAAIFAVYRVAHMIALEEGPFEVFTRVRNLRLQDDWIGRGLRCPLCVGFWLALPAAWVAGEAPLLLWWLGIAGAQAALQGWIGDADAR